MAACHPGIQSRHVFSTIMADSPVAAPPKDAKGNARCVSSSFERTQNRTKNKSLSRSSSYLPKHLKQNPEYRNLSEEAKKIVRDDAAACARTLIMNHGWQALNATKEAIRQALARWTAAQVAASQKLEGCR
jgi:hypothetical protein